MSKAESKLQLLKIIMESEDQTFISKVMQFAENIAKTKSSDWSEELPPTVMNDLMESIDQAQKGNTIPHDVAMTQLRNKFPQIGFKWK